MQQRAVRAVALLVIAITTAIRKHKKSSIKYEIIYLVTAAVSFIANMLAPGNKARFLAEVPNWMPDFNNLSLFDKITIGMDRLNNHVHYPDNITLFVFCLIALFIASRKNGFSLISCAAIIFAACMRCTSFLPFILSSPSIIQRCCSLNLSEQIAPCQTHGLQSVYIHLIHSQLW